MGWPLFQQFQNCDFALLKGFHSKSSDIDKSKLEYQFILLNIKINDEPNYILCCRRAFSNVLGGVTS